MLRKKKKSKAPKTPKTPSGFSRWWNGLDASRQSALRRRFATAAVVLVLSGAAAVGMKMLEGWVLRQEVGALPETVRVVLTDRPAWMPASLDRDICGQLVGEDANWGFSLTADVFARAEANPWVRKVHMVRKYRADRGRAGVVEVQAEYRQPFARVTDSRGERRYVDAEGFRLPERQVPKYGLTLADSTAKPKEQLFYVAKADAPREPWEIHYIEIYGVAAAAPALGKHWQGRDLADALRLVELLSPRPYRYEISVIDVRNHHHRRTRRDPPFQLIAQRRHQTGVYLTKVLIDRFPLDRADYVISPRRALRQLDSFYADHGCVAGTREYIDLRYDNRHASIN